MKQAKEHREEEYEDSWTESGPFSPNTPQQSSDQQIPLSISRTESHRRVLEILRKQAREMKVFGPCNRNVSRVDHEKEIRELAESRTQSTISYITELEHQVGDLSLQ